MSWSVSFKKKAQKQFDELPENIQVQIDFLVQEIVVSGPMRANWKNFGKLKGTENLYHCHVKTGRPTYVVCWELVDKKVKIVEVYYVGSHEKAPY